MSIKNRIVTECGIGSINWPVCSANIPLSILAGSHIGPDTIASNAGETLGGI